MPEGSTPLVGNSLKAGTTDDFPNSMAAAMENAFQQEWLKVMGTALPEVGQEWRRMIFAAIAQGVVRHLVDNREAFEIGVTVTQVHDDAAVTNADGADFRLQASNEGQVTTQAASGVAHAHTIDVGDIVVSQISDWLVSEGSGTVERVATEGQLYGETP